MTDTLKQWKEEAEARIKFLANPFEVSCRSITPLAPEEVDARILSLISLIERKDEALRFYESLDQRATNCSQRSARLNKGAQAVSDNTATVLIFVCFSFSMITMFWVFK